MKLGKLGEGDKQHWGDSLRQSGSQGNEFRGFLKTQKCLEVLPTQGRTRAEGQYVPRALPSLLKEAKLFTEGAGPQEYWVPSTVLVLCLFSNFQQ